MVVGWKVEIDEFRDAKRIDHVRRELTCVFEVSVCKNRSCGRACDHTQHHKASAVCFDFFCVEFHCVVVVVVAVVVVVCGGCCGV